MAAAAGKWLRGAVACLAAALLLGGAPPGASAQGGSYEQATAYLLMQYYDGMPHSYAPPAE